MSLYFQFKDWESIFEVIHCRRRVGFENGIYFIIHPNEQGHKKPHLHAQYQDKQIVLEIPTGFVLAGNLPGKKAKKASEWVVENEDFLIQEWNKLTNGVMITVL